jgi:hypothetical protein
MHTALCPLRMHRVAGTLRDLLLMPRIEAVELTTWIVPRRRSGRQR